MHGGINNSGCTSHTDAATALPKPNQPSVRRGERLYQPFSKLPFLKNLNEKISNPIRGIRLRCTCSDGSGDSLIRSKSHRLTNSTRCRNAGPCDD
jgi:hypothetical protein